MAFGIPNEKKRIQIAKVLMKNPIYCLINRFKDGSKEDAFLISISNDCCACLDNGIMYSELLIMTIHKHAIYWILQTWILMKTAVRHEKEMNN